MTTNPSTLSTVTYIRFVLRMVEAGAVTTPRAANKGEVDAVPDVDHRGVVHLPGTTLAGALRAWTKDRLDAATADRWFGHLLKPHVDTGDGTPPRTTVDAVASAVWVLGSQLVDDAGKARDDDTELRVDRWSTAIDPSRAAAKANTLRGVTLLLPGTRFEVFLRWDDAAADDLGRFLALLTDWRPMIGHGVTRGLGRCQVETLQQGTLDLTAPDDLLRWLTGHGPDLVRAVAVHPPTLVDLPEPTEAAAFSVALDIAARVTGPLHIGSGAAPEKDADDHQVQVTLREGGLLTIPGSGLKGLLRARVSFILRSVGLAAKACPSAPAGPGDRFVDAGPPCGACWTCGIFGSGGAHQEDEKSVGRRGRIRVTDAVIHDAATRTRTHVAIDRFTGGAAEELLYTLEAVETGRFTLRLETDPEFLQDELFRSVLRLALADLHDGLIGIGRSVTRGYGWVSLDLAGPEQADLLPTVAAAQAALALIVATEGNSVEATSKPLEEVTR